jgi:hypothetical protein
MWKILIAGAFGSLLAAAPSAFAMQRTFVSSSGTDANVTAGCSFAMPCATFATALGVTDPGGEIVALTAGNYASVSVDRSVTLTANPGVHAGIVSATTDTAITIGASDIKVTLRGLTVLGGARGIYDRGYSNVLVIVERCHFERAGVAIRTDGIVLPHATGIKIRVSNSVFQRNGTGIWMDGGQLDVVRSRIIDNGTGIVGSATNAPEATLISVSDSVIVGNSQDGIYLNGNSQSSSLDLAVTRSTISQNARYGIGTDNPVTTADLHIVLTDSMIAANGTGIRNSNTTTFVTHGDNAVRDNGTDIDGPVTVVPGD